MDSRNPWTRAPRTIKVVKRPINYFLSIEPKGGNVRSYGIRAKKKKNISQDWSLNERRSWRKKDTKTLPKKGRKGLKNFIT
ncbi:MAG: hypothetical protein A2156_05195 [Deltaproteobacteria bacterium RBG_16_48_10]|nr:MAG: hypothetical protein A2156_05195 [Deltaproteobacteria bacterium RBG_16_48_10]